jgi:hypothetical protein
MMPSSYLAHSTAKLKPEMEDLGDNSLRLRLDLGCTATAVAVAAADNFSFPSFPNY